MGVAGSRWSVLTALQAVVECYFVFFIVSVFCLYLFFLSSRSWLKQPRANRLYLRSSVNQQIE